MARFARVAVLALTLTAGSALWPAAAGAVGEAPAAPANDEVANAQPIHSVPASIAGTTVGATTVTSEPGSGCVGQTVASVWYSVQTTGAERLAVELAAGGKLDGTIDVYKAVRSQLQPVACAQTEEEGKASLTFKAQKNTQYEIRVAALPDSQLASFTLNVFQPTPAVGPPGPRLPAGGVSGQVDRIQNINAAYSVSLHAGVSYLINLANETRGACVNGALFAPGTTSFEGASARLRVDCGGYRLFTPGPGKGGLYSFEVTPSSSHKGEQRFHLQVAPANGTQTAPGLALGNYGRVRGRLEGTGIQVVRLYRMDVTSHSNLTLRLSAPQSAEFNLALRDQNGAVIACSCGGSGPQRLQQQLRKGRYYVEVSVRNHTSGDFALTRESRTITHTKIAFAATHGTAGQAVPLEVHVTPAASGPVTVEVQRFDPVFGWQYYREVKAQVSEGSAAIPFTPPAVGNWRANASYAGSRVTSPSAVGFTYLLVR
ncbi:MAG: hypothetical protein ACRDLF_05595 [Solirubrobacteraceae bacterium]